MKVLCYACLDNLVMNMMSEEEWNRLSYLFKKAWNDLHSLTPEEYIEFINIDPAVMGILALTYSDEPVEETINRLLKGEFGKKKEK
jgi:hypothetical protein